MTYRITGLHPTEFSHLIGRADPELAAHGAVRVTARAKPGYPCRITLEDAEPGETLILLNHVSHDVATPYRSAYAIYVRECASASATFEGTLPPVFLDRPIAFRAFDDAGMLRTAALALPGEAEDKIAMLFAQPEIAYLHAHNAAHGCFAAKVERAS